MEETLRERHSQTVTDSEEKEGEAFKERVPL